MAVPKFYYHITQKKWPDRKTLTPRIRGSNRGYDEPKVSRICVSSSIEGCLVALGSCLSQHYDIYIYRTVSKVIVENPYNVSDSKITKEKWITKPTKFMKIGVIDSYNPNIPRRIYSLCAGGHNDRKQIRLLKSLKDRKQNFITWTK